MISKVRGLRLSAETEINSIKIYTIKAENIRKQGNRPKEKRRQEYKINAEIKEIDNRRTTEKNNETKVNS